MQIPHLVHRLNLTKKEFEWLKVANSLISNQDFRELYLEYGPATYELVHYWAAQFGSSATEELAKPFWKILNPKFTLTGKDLLTQGCLPGPNIGSYLKNTQNWWVQNNFTPNYKECLDYAITLFKQ